MVLPYLKGFINKESFHIISGFICIVLYFHLKSIVISWLDLQQLVSELFLGHKSGDFFYFLQGFGGGDFAGQICTFWCKICKI